MARKGKKRSSQRSAISSQPKGESFVGAVSNRDRVIRYPEKTERLVSLGHPARSGTNPLDGLVLEDAGVETANARELDANKSSPALTPIYRDDAHGIWLYQGNSAGARAGCLAILDAIYAKHGEAGCFDMIAVRLRRRLVRLGFCRPAVLPLERRHHVSRGPDGEGGQR